MKLLQFTCALLCIAGLFASPVVNFEVEADATTEGTEAPITGVTVIGSSTMPTIEPLSTASTISSATIEPPSTGSAATIVPPSGSPGSAATLSTPATMSTMSTMSTGSTAKTTTQKPPEKQSGFDGGSFGGGIGLGIGVCIIVLVVWKCYVMRTQSKGYNTM